MDEMTIRYFGKQNKGYCHSRTKFVDPINNDPNREKAFSQNWRKVNKKQAGINYGLGVLQDLLIEQPVNPIKPARMILKVSRRERFIVATVIQWLGSNCGFIFLDEALKKCGYKIVKDEKKTP